MGRGAQSAGFHLFSVLGGGGKVKRIAGIGLWLLVFVVGLFALDRAMRRDDSERKYSAFFGETQDFDVFFLGTSHVMDAIYPIELWRDFGITSYNFGNTAETPEATYWTLRLALEAHTPKAVLVDVCYIDRSQEEHGVAAFAHTFLDAVPTSLTKLEAIWSLFPQGSRAEFVFPFVTHHARWEEILSGGDVDTVDSLPCMFGAELRVGRAEPAPFARTQEMDLTQTQGKQAIREIIALCRERGIEPVLIATPFPADENMQKMMNSAQAIADECGVTFLNLFDVADLVDFQTDCYDPMSHLNPDGAAKVTAYLGQWLSENFSFADKRSEAQYAHWNEALAEYERIYQESWGDMTLLAE